MGSNWKGTKGEWRIAFMSGLPEDEADFWVKSDVNEVVHYGTDIMQDDFGDHNGYPRQQRMEDAKLIADAGNTIQQCDKLPSELLSERDDAVRIIREAIDLYENRGVDIPELWIDNAFLFIKQIENGK